MRHLYIDTITTNPINVRQLALHQSTSPYLQGFSSRGVYVFTQGSDEEPLDWLINEPSSKNSRSNTIYSIPVLTLESIIRYL